MSEEILHALLAEERGCVIAIESAQSKKKRLEEEGLELWGNLYHKMQRLYEMEENRLYRKHKDLKKAVANVRRKIILDNAIEE